MNSILSPRLPVFSLRALLLLAAFSFPHTLEAATAPECGAPTPAESWVLKEVTAGRTADLKRQYPEEKFPESARTIRACFLKGLLTDSAKRPDIRSNGLHVIGAVVPDALDLSNANIPHPLTLESFQFKDAVRFVNARIDGDLIADGSHFHKEANFDDVRVEGDAFFAGAVFEDGASFMAAHTAASFEASDVEFRHAEHSVSFYNVTIGGDAVFHKAVFGGSVNFTNADIKWDFEARGARFTNPKATAMFHSAKVGQDMLLGSTQAEGDDASRPTVFQGQATFVNINVNKDFEADEARFENAECSVNLFSAKIGGNVFFADAVFAGGLYLAKADVGGNMELVRAKATNASQRKDFTGMKADVLMIENSELRQPYRLQGVNYRMISGGSTEEILRFIENAEYDPDSGPDVYINLENYFQKSGHQDAARRVHVARKWREGSGLVFSRPLKYLWNWVEFLSSGYGQYLFVSLLWSLVMVVVGTFIFRREEYMVTQALEDANRYEGKYNPFWYSLALFLPIVDLPDAKTWMPRLECRKRRIYMRAHILFGYLLIPVALAAWTGIIK